MKHPILGEIQTSDGEPFDAKAVIRHGTHDVELGLIRDDAPLEVTIALAADVVSRLPELDRLAKQVAAKDLCHNYNDGWNEYDEVQEDGSLQSVAHPDLSEAEFAAKLSLRSVNVTGTDTLELYYDDEGMFWGHSVVVSSTKGVDFADARAELFG